MNTATEIVGIAFSQEELLAALLIADLPAPPGYEDLPQRVFGDLPDTVQNALLAAAERGLVAHGMLAVNTDGTTLDDTIRTWLLTATQPDHSWVVLHQPAGQAQQISYFHARVGRYLAHMEQLGVHQFLQIGGSADIQATAIQLVEPLMETVPDTWVGTLPESTFAALTSGNTRPNPADLQAQLTSAGWNSDAAQAFTAALEQLVSMTAVARFTHAAQPPLTRAFTIVRGQNSQWALNPAAPGMLKIQAVQGEQVVRALQEFGDIGK